MSIDLKFKPDLAFVRSWRNSGSSGCCLATSSQSMDMSPTALMTQLRSETEASALDADAARLASEESMFPEAVGIGLGSSLHVGLVVWTLHVEFGLERADGSAAIGNDADDNVDRPDVAGGDCAVGSADPPVEVVDRLGTEDVVVCVVEKVEGAGW